MMVSNNFDVLLEKLYFEKVKSDLDVDLNRLKFSNYDLTTDNCKKCDKRWKVLESGLSEKNICLYIDFLKKTGKKNYCIGKGFIHDSCKDHAGEFIFCYDEDIVPVIEEVVKKADFIKAIYTAKRSTLKEIKKISCYKKINKELVEKIFSKKADKTISNRMSMWHEIDEGIRRVLGNKPKKCKTMILKRGGYPVYNKCKIFVMHGDELRNLIQNNSFAVDENGNNIKVDCLMFGHYHLQMVLIRYNTIILLSGCFVSDSIGYKDEFITHMGAPSWAFSDKGIAHVSLMRLIPS